MTYFLGIDPGHSGAVSVLETDGSLLHVFDTPLINKSYDVTVMLEILRDYQPARAALEIQHAMPKQGVTSTFETGYGYGLWYMALSALGIPFDLVRAQDWKRSLGIPAGSDKSASVAAAQRLFPSGEFTGPKGGIKDGRAEAALIAEWKRRQG